MDPKKMRNSMIDVDTIMDLLQEKRELYLTLRAEDVQLVKQRLSQAKFNRGISDRLRMVPGEPYKHCPVRLTGSKKDITPIMAVDLHLKLGSGTDVFVIACRPADDTL